MSVGIGIHEPVMVRTSELGITLLHIAEPLSEELDRDIFVVRQQMPLSRRSGKVDQGVGVRREACYATNNIPVIPNISKETNLEDSKEEKWEPRWKEGRKAKKHIRIKQINLLPTPTVSTFLRT